MEKIKNILQNKNLPDKGQHTAHQQLAVEIAESFNDIGHIGVYLRICKQFDLARVRKAWKDVLEIKPRNPGAYFTKVMYAKT